MTDEERISKNKAIKDKGKETRSRHASMRPLTVELKLDLKCLNKTEINKLHLFFVERMSDFDASYEAWKHSAGKPEAPSFKHC